ncbi:MAG: AMP-binding protein [Acidimicrobiia bacterium]|nr:AMP-binding protein [Acidimicrobiia bacterium]
METLVSRIERAAVTAGSVTFLVGGGKDQVPWSQLHSEALDLAAELQVLGLRPGGHLAILGPTTRALVTAIQATWLAGATLVVLPLPMRLGSLEEFTAQTRDRVRSADVDLLLVDADLAPFIGEPVDGDPPTALLQDVVAASADPSPLVRPDVRPDDLALLQFTSGSTSQPKGVMLPHRTICANHDAMIEVVGISADDVLVSWLPLYHDMGLVGMLLVGMTTGVDLVLASPQDFLGEPARWMEWVSEYGATVTAGPNFSWVLATRAMRTHTSRGLAPLDLSRLRIGLNGAEPVDPATMRALIEAGEPHRLDAGAVFPAFGMAEVAIGGTFPAPLSGLRTDWVDVTVLEGERYASPASAEAAGARELVKLGAPVPGLEMRIVDPDSSATLGPREVGELQLRGTSVTTGYYKDPAATADLLRDGWLCTGDLAYEVDGDLVICGRIKDVIIVGGRNVFPQDVERVVGEVDGVRAGNVIAFGVPGRHGKESLVVVAESRGALGDEASCGELRGAVATRVREAVGLPVRDVVLVPPSTLPKTSSGKLQRSLCKSRYLAKELDPVS